MDSMLTKNQIIYYYYFAVFSFHRKDEFKIECPSVGEINKILIGHNNKGTGPGWFLDRILVEDLNEHRIYEFPCNRWLATDEDDGQISRFLFPKKGGSSTPMPTDGKIKFILFCFVLIEHFCRIFFSIQMKVCTRGKSRCSLSLSVLELFNVLFLHVFLSLLLRYSV